MFINSKKSFAFPYPGDKDQDVLVPADFLGEVPDWVAKTRLFELAVRDNSITMVGREKMIPASVSCEEKALRAKAKALNIEGADALPLMGLALSVYEAENSIGDSEPEQSEPSSTATEPAQGETSTSEVGQKRRGKQAPPK